jgi:hypothetical protein
MATKLRKLVIDEVSLTDKGANPGAVVRLIKRDAPAVSAIEKQLLKDIDVAIAALAKSVGSIIGDEDLDDDETASTLRETFLQYQNHLEKLIPSGFNKAITAAFPNEPDRRGVGVKDDPREFLASGSGEMHAELWRRFDNLRRSGGAYAGQKAFAQAWDSLDDTQKQEIRNEEAAAEAARVAEEAKRKAAAENERIKMNKTQLIDVAKRVIDGGNVTTTRNDLYAAARKLAIADRQAGETEAKAMAKFWESPAGRDVYAAMQIAKTVDVDVRSNVVDLGPAMIALHKRADDIRRGTSMTREAAVAKIATTPTEASIWRAAKSEQLEQVS